MIVKNEEDVIANCLESIKDIVDEIIIIDTGSQDKTKEIIKNTLQRFMILNGLMILLLQEIFPLARRLRIISFG
ncbi:glycosyltransferase involved in cell wall biosynthesis [Clostridium beijerinckii]|nr:glycosyltransferase involved in cell wall biosynthesis [Clostridium beijerinckii]